MNLEEEIKKVSHSDGCERIIVLSEAIKIAKQYAKEMCEKQKEICIKVAWDKNYGNANMSINAYRPKTPIQIREDLINAPLATEE